MSILDYAIPIPESGCWLWERQNKGGSSNYGLTYVNGKRITAHRQSWIENNGPIPTGMHVLHKCDVPLCVNPNHLYLGTHQQNMRDLHERTRRYGENHWNSKLTASQVNEIKEKAKLGVTGYSLAKKFGVNEETVYDILNGRTWKKV